MTPQDKIERLRLALVALKEAAEELHRIHYHTELPLFGIITVLDARADDAQSALEECGYG